jgi:hypothetical protein
VISKEFPAQRFKEFCVSRRGCSFPADGQWNNGTLGIKNGFYHDFSTVLLPESKKDFILLNPLFQPSNIPSFNVISLQHRLFTMAWAIELDFRRWNKGGARGNAGVGS